MEGTSIVNSSAVIVAAACEEEARRRRRHKRSLVSPDDKENDTTSIHRRSSSSNPKKKKKKKKTKNDNDNDSCEHERSKKKSKRQRSQKDRNSKKTTTKTTTRTLLTMTPNAVESLVAFAQSSGKDKPCLEKDLVVRIRLEENSNSSSKCLYGSLEKPPHDQTLLATLDDSTHTLPVLLLNDPRNDLLQSHLASASTGWITVVARGLIATDGHNPRYDLDPIVCLTTVEILSKMPLEVEASGLGSPYRLPTRASSSLPQSPSPGGQQQQQQQSSSSSTARVRAGTVGSFLDQTLPFITTDEFTRCHDTTTQRLLLSEPFSSLSSTTDDDYETKRGEDSVVASIETLNQHAEQVQTFLTRHSAMMTLQANSQPTEHAVQNYTNALREFASSQLDRQKASLATNAGREAEDRASLITLQYTDVLERAMSKHDDEWSTNGSKEKDRVGEGDCLTSNRLLQWHSTLLNDLHTEAGQIRTKTVRAGHTVFCRPKEIAGELDKFCLALTNLQERLHLGRAKTTIGGSSRPSTPTSSTNNTASSATNAWHAILFAAVAMYGIVDIHPFADGNGRMSRIVANWALKSFPFTINLFATPAQRAEYILALEQTRHLLSLSNQKKIHGAVTSHEILQVTKSIGIFAPLVRLLMDRMGRAVVEFHRVWQEKSGLAAEALECKAARQARERAKEGTCIICLDENPNIATLCCGKAVHLNCIAEWLSGKNSCPCCRSELPSISGRVVRAARNGATARGDNGGGDGDAVSPSSRRLHRRYFRNAHDVIVNLLNNYNGENHNSTTETAEDDGYDSAHDTTTAEVRYGDDDEDEIILDEDDEEGSSSSSDEDDDSSDEDSLEDSDDSSYVMIARSVPRTTDRIEDHDSGLLSGQESSQDDASITSSHENGRDQSDNSQDYVAGPDSDMGQDTTAEDEENGPVDALTPRVNEYCDALYCRNRPAIDCANSLCGRCCVLGGEFHCPRHNS